MDFLKIIFDSKFESELNLLGSAPQHEPSDSVLGNLPCEAGNSPSFCTAEINHCCDRP